MPNNKEVFKIGSSTSAGQEVETNRRKTAGTSASPRRLGARENFSIIAATVIKPNKREITASTRGTRPHYPKSWKSSQPAAADLMAFGKATAGRSKVVHHPSYSFGHSLSFGVFFFFRYCVYIIYVFIILFVSYYVNYSGLHVSFVVILSWIFASHNSASFHKVDKNKCVNIFR